MGDKKVLKKIMKVGEGFDRPSEGSLAKGNFSITFYNCNILPLRFKSFSCFSRFLIKINVNLKFLEAWSVFLSSVAYIGKLENGTVFERKGSREEPLELLCFEGILCFFIIFFLWSGTIFPTCVTLKCFVLEQINEGLDRAIMTMRKGEQALVTIQADGHEVSGMVSANSLHHYEVELIDFTKVFCSQIFSVTLQKWSCHNVGNLGSCIFLLHTKYFIWSHQIVNFQKIWTIKIGMT